MGYYGEAVVDSCSHILGGDGANVSLTEAAKDLDLPLFAVFGDTSIAGSPAAV